MADFRQRITPRRLCQRRCRSQQTDRRTHAKPHRHLPKCSYRGLHDMVGAICVNYVSYEETMTEREP
jgi:hypothetical protein